MPEMVGLGAFRSGASASLLAYLRIPAGIFISVAIVNWMVRKAEPSATLKSIVLGNICGFGLTAILQVLSVFSGNLPSILVFAVINALFAIAFILVLIQGRTQQPDMLDSGTV